MDQTSNFVNIIIPENLGQKWKTQSRAH